MSAEIKTFTPLGTTPPQLEDMATGALVSLCLEAPGFRSMEIETTALTEKVSFFFECRSGTLCWSRSPIKGGDIHGALVEVIREYERLY